MTDAEWLNAMSKHGLSMSDAAWIGNVLKQEEESSRNQSMRTNFTELYGASALVDVPICVNCKQPLTRCQCPDTDMKK